MTYFLPLVDTELSKNVWEIFWKSFSEVVHVANVRTRPNPAKLTTTQQSFLFLRLQWCLILAVSLFPDIRVSQIGAKASIFQSESNPIQAIKCQSRDFQLKEEQDGRLAPAYFSPNYIYFDQLLQTVKNKTTVLISVFKEFLRINSTTDFCTLCQKVSRFSLENFSYDSDKKFRRGTPLCFRKFLLSKNDKDKRGGIKIFRRNVFVPQDRKTS